jgi:hypothetical protein
MKNFVPPPPFSAPAQSRAELFAFTFSAAAEKERRIGKASFIELTK